MIMVTKFNTKKAIQLAVAIYRKQSYVSRRTEKIHNNENMLYTHLLNNDFSIIDNEDKKITKKMIYHYEGLLIKKITNDLNFFQEIILALIIKKYVYKKDIPLLAILPDFFLNPASTNYLNRISPDA